MDVGRVIVAMSGGVDSSVAAARLVRAGHDVVGVTLHLWDYPDDGSVRGRCCAPEDVHDARRVADRLGIPHFAFDRRELFEREVVRPFVDEYLTGTTPSPCVRCNHGVKLPELEQLADRLGATHLATGHYARIERVGGRVRLARAHDERKDQSYFLHGLPERALERLLFPLGESSKSEVRAEAVALGLPGAHKGESQELCFVPEGRYDAFVRERAAHRVRPGRIVDESGRELGRHLGVHGFTLGQRKGLGVATGERSFVVGVDVATGTVSLGRRETLATAGALLEDVALAPGVALPLDCDVAVRYRGEPRRAKVRALGEARAALDFEVPVDVVVPGQFAVFYKDGAVLGGGRIASALRVGEGA